MTCSWNWELHEGEENYRLLFNTMTEGFALHEIICNENGEPSDFRFLDTNPAFERLTGLKRENVIGKTYYEIFPDKDPAWIKALGDVAITGKAAKFERYSPALKRHYDVSAYSPAPYKLAVLFKDITDYRMREDELRKSEAKNKAILDALPDLMFHIAADGTFLSRLAPSFLDIYLPPESSPGRKIQDLMPPEITAQAITYMKKAQETNCTQVFEYKLLKGGHEDDYEARIVVCSLGGLLFLVRNVTERKRLEDALKESEHRFHLAIDNVPYTFVIYDKDLRIQYINRAGIESSGLEDDQIIGRTYEEIFPPDVTGNCLKYFREALETKAVQTFESTQIHPSGSRLAIVNYIPILNDDGHVSQIMGITYDVTEMKEAKRKLEQALKENEKQNRILKTVIVELSENYREIEELLYNISNDLMVPLITIEGYMGLLRKDVKSGNRIRIEIDLGLISDSVSRMQKLLEGSLELSNLGRLTKAEADVPFGEIVEEAIEHLKNNGSSGNVHITVNKDFPLVHVDKDSIVDVLINLIDFHIICSSEGHQPRVFIGHKTEEDGLIFLVRSDSIHGGIEDQSHIPYPSQNEEIEYNGHFMGLAISKRIIERHGGRMWIDRAANSCTIYFTLSETKKCTIRSVQ